MPLWGSNLVTNGGAEGDLSGWTTSNVASISGGTRGSYCFDIRASGNMSQTISPLKADPQAEQIRIYVDARVQTLTTLSNAYMTFKINYSDGFFDEYTFPFNNAIYKEVSGFVYSQQLYWAVMETVLPTNNEKTISNYSIKITNNSSESFYIDDLKLEEDQGIPAAGVPEIPPGSITEEELADGAVGRSKLQYLAVDTAYIENLAVTNAKIANLAVDSAKIKDLAVTNAKIENLAVTTAKIEDLTVTTAKIANAAITSAKIGEAQIGTAHIQDAAITSAKILDGTITNAKIGNAAIDTAQIKDASITDAKIDRASINRLVVVTADIADASITNAKIDRATVNKLVVGTADIADASITNAKIEDATITGAKIATGTIGTALIGDSVITTALIKDAAITDAKIVSLTAGKITAGTIDTSQVTVQGPSGHLRLTGNRIQVFDSQAVPIERVSMGDVLGDGSVYGFLMRGADGTTVLMDINGVKSAGITDGAITNPKIGDGQINNRVIAADTITGDKLIADTITAREIKAGVITAESGIISNATIGTALIIDAAITTAKIGDAQITNAKIANAAINTAQIVDASITNAKIDRATVNKLVVTTADIADAAITTAKIGDVQITNAKIADATIESAKIKSIQAQKIDVADFTNLCAINEVSNPLNYTTVTIGGFKYFKIGSGAYSPIELTSTTRVEFKTNDEYYISFEGYRETGISSINFIIRYYYTDGTWNNAGTVTLPFGTSNNFVSGNCKITSMPTSAKTVSRVSFFVEKDNTTTGYYYMRNIELRKRYGGTLIVDGSITANHIKTNELVVGTNVSMGPNAYISWDNITSPPTIPNGTYIDASGVYTGTIVADKINGGTIRGVTIDVTTDLTVGNNIQLGVGNFSQMKAIKFNDDDTWIHTSGDGLVISSLGTLQFQAPWVEFYYTDVDFSTAKSINWGTNAPVAKFG